MKVSNTAELLDPKVFRFVGLIYSLPGCGKTTWLGTCPSTDLEVAACETGHGGGLLSIADKKVDFCIPETLDDLVTFCKTPIFKNKTIKGLDSITAMARTFIKDAALRIPRAKGESDKRKMGIPELDDYGSIGELTRKVIQLLITANPDKHVIVTALEKYDKPNENDPPGTESLIGPDLAGQLFLAAPAMFDFVLRMRTRSKLRDPKDAKSRYSERFFMTQQEQGVIAKCRAVHGKPLLDREEVFDQETGQGSFPYLLDKIVKGYEGLGEVRQ